MQRHRIIVPTGYMGSGSSAMTDLISEMDGYEASQGSFEYVFLHCPNGVFDLEDKLLIGNTALRSDEALHCFMHTMRQLYDKKYWWVGHYRDVMGEVFWRSTEEYIADLISFVPNFYWYHQENCDRRMIVKLVLKRLVAWLTFGKIKLPKPLLYEPMWIAYPDEETFYAKTRAYLQKIWEACGVGERNIILDQLLLPHNLHRLAHYFVEQPIDVFVVERDPRDVFLINKYVCAQRGGMVPYPTEAAAFARAYRELRAIEKPAAGPQIHRLYFEDLVYHYEETSAQIRDILGVSDAEHTRRRTRFDPAKSIRNTQLFLRNERWRREVEPIAECLEDFLYAFPYEYQYDGGDMF